MFIFYFQIDTIMTPQTCIFNYSKGHYKRRSKIVPPGGTKMYHRVSI